MPLPELDVAAAKLECELAELPELGFMSILAPWSALSKLLAAGTADTVVGRSTEEPNLGEGPLRLDDFAPHPDRLPPVAAALPVEKRLVVLGEEVGRGTLFVDIR